MATKPAPKSTPKPAAPKSPKSPKPATTAVAVKAKGELVTGSVMEILRNAAARGRTQVAKAPSAQGNTLSFRQGMISFGGMELGHEIPVVFLAPQFRRVYYSQDFNPDVKLPPDCYSYDNEKPHEKAFAPQAASCDACSMNEWKSDKRQKGKACKEGLRVAMIHADKAKTPDDVANAQIVQADFSVLNTKILQTYLDGVYENFSHPAMVITKLECHPDQRVQLKNDFSVIEAFPADSPIVDALSARIVEAEAQLVEPFPDMPEGMGAAARKPANKTASKVKRF